MTYDLVVQLNDPQVQTFDPVTDSVGSCGSLDYNLSGTLFDDGVIWLSGQQLMVWTVEGEYINTHTVELHVTLADYPLLDYVVGLHIPFQVVIISDCANTELMAPAYELIEYYQWNQENYSQAHRDPRGQRSEIFFEIQDTLSLGLSNLCGPRVYTWAFESPEEPGDQRKIEITASETGYDATLEFWEEDEKLEYNLVQIVTVTVSLERYSASQVAPISFDVKLFFMKECRDQAIIQGMEGIRTLYMTNVVGGGPSTFVSFYFFVECDMFFKYQGQESLSNQHICGEMI